VKRLYVGNIPYDLCTDEGLRAFFDGFDVESTHVVMDKAQDRPRGFCFVEMANPNEAQRALNDLNGTTFHGRSVTVRLAHEKPQRDERPRRDRNERRARN
jgi:cold-inducible RNA-binding protein